MTPILSCENLSIGYGNKPIVSGVSLSLRKGEVTALLGRNGAGKSTLIKTLTGSRKPLTGKICIDGRLLNSYSKKERSRILGIVGTERGNIGGLKVRELVSLGRIPYTGKFGRLNKEDKEIIADAIDNVGLSHKKDAFMADLSDGERQKAIIARGMVQETPLLILDEPFAFLDIAARLELLSLIKFLAKENDKAILFSSHEVTEVLRMADKLWMFVRKEGELSDRLIEGIPAEIVESNAINRLFPDSNVYFDGHEFVAGSEMMQKKE